MRDSFVKLRLKDARTIADPIRRPAASYELELALRRLDDLIAATEKLSARKKARPLNQRHKKPSKLDRLRKAHGARGAKARKTMEVYDAVEQRAGGVCECGCGMPFLQTLAGAPEMDHFWGRRATGDRAESADTCWMLRSECHERKTNSKPSRQFWLIRFRNHSERFGSDLQAALVSGLLDAIRIQDRLDEARVARAGEAVRASEVSRG